VPFRPDLFASHGGGYNAQKRAVDTIRPGEVLVMDARRDPTAGTLGDILALRAQVRGAAGIVTDGAARDAAAIAALDLPVYTSGRHPAVLGRRHVPWETDVTIACGGATVQVGDVIVADDDGAVVIPPGLVEDVLAAAEQQEREEAWIAGRVADGAGLDGLYPLAGQWRQRYEESR
jgi:regulator of RNase E activity RraA